VAYSPVSWTFRDPVTSAKLAQMVANITDHDHRLDNSQGESPAGKVAAGTVATPLATGQQVVAISFPAGRFTVPPRVIVGANSGAGGFSVSSIGLRNLTATGFEAVIGRENATSTILACWIAIERDS
jgi:hypothetical protein